MPSGSVTTLTSPKLPQAMPRRAMVLAAGLGLRMRPLTEDRPKPLIEVGGRTLLDRILDRLAESGITDVVINLHAMAEMIECHLEGRRVPNLIFSPEPELLETGGGTMAALAHLGQDPFFVVNADVLWLDGWHNALARLAEAWNDETMDALLLVHPCARAFGYRGRGDFVLDQSGRLLRRPEIAVAPFVFTGISMLHPRLFEGGPKGAFSLNVLYLDKNFWPARGRRLFIRIRSFPGRLIRPLIVKVRFARRALVLSPRRAHDLVLALVILAS